MRTTLDIDEDVLAAAKELARRQRLSTGRVVSRLLRQGLTGQGLPVASSGLLFFRFVFCAGAFQVIARFASGYGLKGAIIG